MDRTKKFFKEQGRTTYYYVGGFVFGVAAGYFICKMELGDNIKGVDHFVHNGYERILVFKKDGNTRAFTGPKINT